MKINWERSKAVSGWIVAILLAVSFYGYVIAVNPSFSTVIGPGSMADHANYYLFTDGTNYFAKNGTTGSIDYSGSNFSFVFQSAIDAASAFTQKYVDTFNNGGPLIQISPGNYSISWTIYIRHMVSIQGAGVGTTRFQPIRTGITVFLIQPISITIQILMFSEFKIDHWGTAIAATGITFDTSKGGAIYEFKMDAVEIRDMSNGGITGTLGGQENWFYRSVFLSSVTLTGATVGTSYYFENNVISGTTTITVGYLIFEGNDVFSLVKFTGSSTYSVATFSGNLFHTQGGSATKILSLQDRGSPATINAIEITGNSWNDPATTGTTSWIYIGNNVKNVQIVGNEFTTAGSTGSISWGTGVTGLTINNNPGYNPQPISSITSGTSPYTFPALPWDAIYVITTVGGMSALTLDGQALFGGSFSVGQQVYVSANHVLIATWTTTASVFEILPQ